MIYCREASRHGLARAFVLDGIQGSGVSETQLLLSSRSWVGEMGERRADVADPRGSLAAGMGKWMVQTNRGYQAKVINAADSRKSDAAALVMRRLGGSS